MAAPQFTYVLQNGTHGVLQHIKRLLQTHTDWTFSASEFHLMPHPATVVLAHDEHNAIVACAVLANPVQDSATYWLSFVIVAKPYRRMGVATAMLTKLLNTVTNGYVALAASPTAVSLYQSFAFQKLSHLTVGYWSLPVDKQSDATALQRHHHSDHNVLTITDEADAIHTAAKELYERVGGKRAFALDHIVKHATNGRCIAYLNEDKRSVYAAAWIRTVQTEGGHGVQAWLGPFVGGTDRARLISVLKRVARECARMPDVRVVSCLGLNGALLKEAAFENASHVPIMALRVDDGRRSHGNGMEHVELAPSSPTHHYHALCYWMG